MTEQEVIDEVKLEVAGGGVLQLEITDDVIAKNIHRALRELQRYWDESSFIIMPWKSCIDLSELAYSSIVKVYRLIGIGNSEKGTNVLTMDPLYAQQWMIFSNAGTMFNIQDYVLNYAAWNTLNQTVNTISTDMAFREDRHNHLLYINSNMSSLDYVSIEFIPKLSKVDDIKSDYWQDILVRMSIDLTKITLGRIRTRYKQSNALWEQDGDAMLEEGRTDLSELREVLRQNSNLVYPID